MNTKKKTGRAVVVVPNLQNNLSKPYIKKHPEDAFLCSFVTYFPTQLELVKERLELVKGLMELGY